MLSDEQIENLNYISMDRLDYEIFEIDQGSVKEFARAIEAEVRKQDDVLIRQMHDAMSNLTTLCLSGGSPLFTAEFDRLIEATTAARARLGEKT